MRKRDEVRTKGGIFNIYYGDCKKNLATNLEDTGLLKKGTKGNFVMTPRNGPSHIGMTSGVQKPGQGMEPHIHPVSDETLLCVKGKGQFYLHDHWIDVREGDVVFAPAGIKHGSRCLQDSDEALTVVGISCPPQLDLYQKSDYDPNGADEDYEQVYHV